MRDYGVSRLNTRPSYQMLLQKCSGHYASLSAMFSPLHSTTVKVPLQRSKNMTIRTPPTINYCLESAVAITLRLQPCSARYTALQTKNSVRIASAINPVTTENTDDSHLQMEAMHRATANQHLGLSAQRNGTQRKTKVSL